MYDFILTLFTTVARALLAHGCGEALRWLLDRCAPGIPPLACSAIGLVIGVILIEIMLVLWHRRHAADHE